MGSLIDDFDKGWGTGRQFARLAWNQGDRFTVWELAFQRSPLEFVEGFRAGYKDGWTEEEREETIQQQAEATCERIGHKYVEMYQDGRDSPSHCTRCGRIEF